MAIHPDTMRRIDRWAGIPLCGLVSLSLPLLCPARKSKDTAPDAVVLICIAEIGALFVAYSAILSAQKMFPDKPLYFITEPKGEAALRIMGLSAEQIVLIRTGSISGLIQDVWAARKKFRLSGKISCAVLEPFTRFSHLIAAWIGAEKRAGCHRLGNEGGYLGNLITHRVVYNTHLHASTQFVAIVQALAETAPRNQPALKRPVPRQIDRVRFVCSDDEKTALQKKLTALSPEISQKRLIILNANASDIVPLRKWSSDNYVSLAKKLLHHFTDIGIVFTGTDLERAKCDALKNELGSAVAVNLAGLTSFRELLVLYSISRLLISNDSGPIHFASVTDIPVIALYGPEHPNVFGPLSPFAVPVHLGLACSPCVSALNQKKSSCTDNQCMKGISVDTVFDLAKQQLLPQRA